MNDREKAARMTEWSSKLRCRMHQTKDWGITLVTVDAFSFGVDIQKAAVPKIEFMVLGWLFGRPILSGFPPGLCCQNTKVCGDYT